MKHFKGCHNNSRVVHIFEHGRDRIVVGFITTCAISAYHHESCEVEPRSWRGVLDTPLCDKVCQLLATGRWFSPGTSFSCPFGIFKLFFLSN
jgi:hypothetical protein